MIEITPFFFFFLVYSNKYKREQFTDVVSSLRCKSCNEQSFYIYYDIGRGYLFWIFPITSKFISQIQLQCANCGKIIPLYKDDSSRNKVFNDEAKKEVENLYWKVKNQNKNKKIFGFINYVDD